MKTKAIVSSITVLISLLVSSGLYAAGTAQDYLKAGEKAVGQKQYDTAVQHLSQALNGSELSSEETAQALYFRGVAYNGKGEPARSIADLTRAIFFKKIPTPLKVNILKARARAYRAVGLGSRAEADLRSAGVSSSQIASSQPSSSFQSDSGSQTQSRTAAVTSGWGANVNAIPSKPEPVQPIRRPQRLVERPQPVQQPQREPQRLARSSSQDARSMFETEARPARQVEARKNAHRANLRSSDWGAEKQAEPRRIAHTENVQTFAKPSRPQISSSGRYRLQLAAVSSENAQNAWAKLVEKHTSLLSNQNPDFQTVSIGNNKSVTRIQIGPFADKLQTLQLCNSFKQDGLDCFLVVR